MTPSAGTRGSASALVLERPRHLVPRTLPLPDVGDDDALLRVEACGLCGTDHEQYSGTLWPGAPFVPGHETVGIVERIGPAAAERWGVDEGTRVAVEVFQSCGACEACRSGTYRRCARHGTRDLYGFVPVDRPPGLWGGYADHLYLSPDALILPVPDGLDPVVATVFNPLGAGIRWGVSVPGTGPGDVVAVLGPGMRGLCAAVAAREAGADVVLVTGRGSRDAARLRAARELGADLTVDVEQEDPVAALRDATGGLADVVVDVTASSADAFVQALDLAAPGGTVVVAGMRGLDHEQRGFRPDTLVVKELRVIGALGVDVTAYRAALDLLASGRHRFADLERRVAGFDELPALLATMAGEGGDPPVHGVFVPDRMAGAAYAAVGATGPRTASTGGASRERR